MADDKPIIVIKKKGGHGGHHGGAWKIAYADFVTAMMAFFMVMWLVNSASNPTKQAIASYFRKPGLFSEGSGTPLQIGGSGILEDSYAPPRPNDIGEKKWEIRKKIPSFKEEQDYLTKQNQRLRGLSEEQSQKENDHNGLIVTDPKDETGEDTEQVEQYEQDMKDGKLNTPFVHTEVPTKKEILEEVVQDLKKQILLTPELKDILGELEVKAETDGIVLEIMDTEKSSMFTSGSSKINPEAKEAFKKLAAIIKPLPNQIDIIGHTDAKPFSNIKGGFSNWELSTSRANEARKLFMDEGYDSTRINSVIGKADREPKLAQDPLAAANRRITLKMKFDLNKTIDMSKNPEELNKTLSETPLPKQPASEDPVHSLSTKEVIEGKKEEDKKVSKSKTKTPPALFEKQKDKIFSTNPVFGPSDIFSDL